VFGPGKFLRGKSGIKSAEEAVKVLEEKAETTIGYFMVGLICIVLSSSLKAFILYSFVLACIVTAGLTFMTYVLVKTGRRIFANMYVDKDVAISGKITAEQVNDPTNVKMTRINI
jgi:hypothetical protein